MRSGLLDKNSHHREPAYGKICRHISYNRCHPRHTHYSPDTFFGIELQKVWTARQVQAMNSVLEKNSGWRRDWAPVAVPIYKRYKQTNNRM